VLILGNDLDALLRTVRVYDEDSRSGVGALDFLEIHMDGSTQRKDIGITLDTLEKWFCLGDQRNRLGLWVQGSQLMTRV
jgi:guanine deaminase